MANIIIIAILICIIVGISVYLVKRKRGGKGCIGCPYCEDCTGKKCS